MTARPHMPLSVKLESALIALGLDPTSVEYNHIPALGLRLFDEVTGKYTPDANDARYIVPMAKAGHRERTAKIDIPAIAKTKRLTKAQIAFRATLLAKQIGDDPPRDVRKRRIQNRRFSRRLVVDKATSEAVRKVRP